jgi:LPXTG-motif cell wall-anchored protein
MAQSVTRQKAVADQRRDLEYVWRHSRSRRTSRSQRWIQEDRLGVQLKSVIFMLAGAMLLVGGAASSQWWLLLFGAAVLAAALAMFISWRRQRS